MKRIILSAVLLGLPLLACDKTVIDNVPFERFDFSVNSDGGATKIPVKPFLGDVLDRVGRPGVNTLLTAPLLAPAATADAAKDAYNKAIETTWTAATTVDNFKSSLGIFDGLDAVCGDQLLAGAAGIDRYKPLATILADDRLYVNTATGVCAAMFSVELNRTTDCGGRSPIIDAFDQTYTALINGSKMPAPMPFGDGIGTDPDGKPADDQFPFLLGPL